MLAAYLAADYVVFTDPPIVLRVGERSPALDGLLEEAGADTAAFVTASNPRGEPTDPAENALSTEALLLAQREAGYACIPGAGRDPRGKWPAEPSVLVIGISRREAEILGRGYEQNAVVFVEAGGAPELVPLV